MIHIMGRKIKKNKVAIQSYIKIERHSEKPRGKGSCSFGLRGSLHSLNRNSIKTGLRQKSRRGVDQDLLIDAIIRFSKYLSLFCFNPLIFTIFLEEGMTPFKYWFSMLILNSSFNTRNHSRVWSDRLLSVGIWW